MQGLPHCCQILFTICVFPELFCERGGGQGMLGSEETPTLPQGTRSLGSCDTADGEWLHSPTPQKEPEALPQAVCHELHTGIGRPSPCPKGLAVTWLCCSRALL